MKSAKQTMENRTNNLVSLTNKLVEEREVEGPLHRRLKRHEPHAVHRPYWNPDSGKLQKYIYE